MADAGLYVLGRSLEILVVDDSPDDAKMILWTLDKGRKRKSVVTLMDGAQAMTYLRTREDGLKPDLILLDLNMPVKDGWEVLAECKGDPLLKAIPIVVFSTSSRPMDVKRGYAMGANSFVTKPFDLADFKAAVEMIEDYWLGLSVSA